MSKEDSTRTRLLDAAGELFAEVGFENATVRKICECAGVNVASVNYHFGDKLGLYTEVLMRGARFAQRAAEATAIDGSPEEQLRAFVRAYLNGLLGTGKSIAVTRLMAAEMARPSPALKKVVSQVVAPTEIRLRTLVSQITGLPPDDDRVRMCAYSIVGQCLHYKHAAPVLRILWPDLWRIPDRLDRISSHIVDFSLAGMRALKDRGRKTRVSTVGNHG